MANIKAETICDLVQVGGSDVTLGQKTGDNSIPVVLPTDQWGPGPASGIGGNPAAITDNTAHNVIAAQATGIRIYMQQLLVTNSHATQGTLVTITDGASGSTLAQGWAGPSGGGFSVFFPTAKRTTAATALSAICGTSGANVYVSASGYIGA